MEFPSRSFARVPRAQFDAHVAAVEEQRDRAIGQRVAERQRLLSWLEQRADSFRQDAAHQDRRVADKTMPASTLTAKERHVVADMLQELALDLERGPES